MNTGEKTLVNGYWPNKDVAKVVAFDVDDTLIIPAVATDLDRDIPNYETIAIYRWFQAQGCYMIIHSGGGADYAKTWAEKLGLEANEYLAKDSRLKDKIDIAVDDCVVDLAKVNIRVKRVNNSVSREEWNKHDCQQNNLKP